MPGCPSRCYRPVPTSPPPRAATALDAVERDHIAAVLQQTGWRIDGPDGAARLLDLKPSTLRSRIRKLGIRRSDRSA